MSILRDTTPFTALRLTEGAVDSTTGRKALTVEGVFQRADVLNANHRIYPKSLWEKVLSNSSLKESLSKRRMFGEVDHPADWRMALARTSHVITDLRMDEQGNVIGKAEILPTPTGLVLEAIMRAGCEVGISSRGTGSTIHANEGHEVVGEDYQLETFDFVATPSTPGAYPKMVMETVERAREIENAIMDSFTKSATTNSAPEVASKKEEVNEMSLDGYRALEREASELVRMKMKGLDPAASALVLNKIEETIGKVVKAGEADKTVALLSAPVLKALEKKRAKLSPSLMEEFPPKSSSSSSSSSDSDSEKDEEGDPLPPDESNIPDYSSPAAGALENKEEVRAMKQFDRLFAEDDMPAFLKKKMSGSSDSSSSDKDEADDGGETKDSNSPMEDEETAGEVVADINAEIPNVTAETIDRRITAFLQEELPDNFKKSSSSSSDSDDSEKDEDEASAYAPDAPAQTADDIVTATEAEIRGLAKSLLRNPAKLEAFVRGTIRAINTDRKARRKAEGLAIKAGKVTEAVIKRHKSGSTAPAGLLAKYKFVCEAVAELQKRYFALKNKSFISEALVDAGVPPAERNEWVKTLSTLTTRAQLVRGLNKVKSLYAEAEDSSSSEADASSSEDDKAKSESKKKVAARPIKEGADKPVTDKHDTLIAEGATIFANARQSRGLR